MFIKKRKRNPEQTEFGSLFSTVTQQLQQAQQPAAAPVTVASVTDTGALSEASASLEVALGKLINPDGKELTGSMVKVTNQLIKWLQQGGVNV